MYLGFFYLFQVVLIISATIWGIKQYRYFEAFKKQKDDINSSLHCLDLYNNLKQTWEFFGFKVLLFSFIPLFGLLAVAFGFFAFSCDKKTIITLTNDLDEIKKANRLHALDNLLPIDLNTKRLQIEETIKYLREKNYHAVVVEDSYQTLISLISDSVIDDCLSEKSLDLIRKAFDDLNILIDKLIKSQKKEDTLRYQEHQKFVDANFKIYEEVISKISKDIETHQSVFESF